MFTEKDGVSQPKDCAARRSLLCFSEKMSLAKTHTDSQDLVMKAGLRSVFTQPNEWVVILHLWHIMTSRIVTSKSLRKCLITFGVFNSLRQRITYVLKHHRKVACVIFNYLSWFIDVIIFLSLWFSTSSWVNIATSTSYGFLQIVLFTREINMPQTY